MLSLSQIKYIQGLQQKKNRRLRSKFVAEGEKIVSELPNSGFRVEGIYATAGWMEQNFQQFSGFTQLTQVSNKELERISGLKSPNQVLAIIEVPETGPVPDLFAQGLCLVLDTVQDPGNLGTIIRTADWFGIRQVICSPDTADVFSPKVVQASMGSFLRVKVSYTELAPFLGKISPTTPIYGAFLEGESLFETALPGSGLLVIGNESKGISAEVSAHVTRKLRIHGGYKTAGHQPAESLNASIAAAIMLAWFTKKRH